MKLDRAQGLCQKAASLVLERVYPTRWVSPKIYAAGAILKIPLQGYETAIYEIYPIDMATEPLLSGVIFDVIQQDDQIYTLQIFNRILVVSECYTSSSHDNDCYYFSIFAI